MATFRIKKEGALYKVYLKGHPMNGDVFISGLVALTQEEAELKLQAAELVLEARRLVGRIQDMPVDVLREAAQDLIKVNNALYNKAKQDPLAREILPHVRIDGEEMRQVNFWRL